MQTTRQLSGINAELIQVTAPGLQKFIDNAVEMRASRLSTMWSEIVRRWRRASQYRRAVRQLSELDDRVLADIGLQRCDISKSVRESMVRDQNF